MAYYQNIHDYRAETIKDALYPYFDRVRFYPKPSEKVYELKEDFTIINLNTFEEALSEIRTP